MAAPIAAMPGWSPQDGVRKPYRGYQNFLRPPRSTASFSVGVSRF